MTRYPTLALTAWLLTGSADALLAQQPADPARNLDSLARDQLLRLVRSEQDHPALVAASFRQLLQLAKRDPGSGAHCLTIGMTVPSLGVPASDPSPALLSQLSDVAPGLRPASACHVTRHPTGRMAVTDTATGRPAELLTIGGVWFSTPEQAVLYLTQYVGPEWAKGWTCEAVRVDGQWRFTTCKLTMIS